MTITTPRPTGAAHLFHRRHNTRPWTPMPAVTRTHRPARPARGEQDRQPVLLVDLTSPWAYLAHLRLAALDDERPASERTAEPAWEAVRGASRVPLTGLRGPGPERERLRQELQAVRRLARDGEELPDDVPEVLPHPRPVSAAYAEAVDLGRGAEVLALLLRAYWVEGQDIGDPEVLRRLLPSVLVPEGTLCTGDSRREWGYVVSPAREPLSDTAYHLLRQWQERWLGLGGPGPLTLVGRTGPRTGADVLEALEPARA